MAIVKKTSETRIRALAKASIRYIMHRPEKDEKISRSLFGWEDLRSGKLDAYEAIDQAPRGSRFLRVAISPDPKREDTYRDLNLREMARITMLALAKEFKDADLQFFAAIHAGHTDKRHVNLLVIFPGGRLTKHHWALLREAATTSAVEQRLTLGPAEISRGGVQFPLQANRFQKARSFGRSYGARRSSLVICPACMGPLTRHGRFLECNTCELSFSMGRTTGLQVQNRGFELVSEKGGRARVGASVDLALAVQLGLDRLSHSAVFSSAKHPIHRARFAHNHELEPLLGGTEPEFGEHAHIGIGPYNRVLRIASTPKHKELGGILVSAPPRSGKTLGVIADLLTWAGSVIVNDVKGELYEKTAGFLQHYSRA